MGTKYAENILDCTSSKDSLNLDVAIQKSPIYWKTPVEKLNTSELQIYAGVYDGIQGSVPITHSINFYNKVLKDKLVIDSTLYVSDSEKLSLLEYRKALDDFGTVNNIVFFENKDLKIYPNPFGEYIYFEGEATENFEVFITDMNGKLLIHSEEKMVATTTLASGIYFLKVHTSNQKVYCTKLVKI
jgi:hypothetical protein